MNKILKWILIFLGTIAVCYVGIWIFWTIAIASIFDGDYYSTQDLIDNYNSKTKEIWEVKQYINQIVPQGKMVDIEFENKEIGIFHIKDSAWNSNWDLPVNSAKTDSLLQQLGWTKETLNTLKSKLDNANCISVKNGEPITIGFQRSGMGKYYYNLFDNPIPAKNIAQYNDSCMYIYYNDTVVLEYGGGAIGSQCFAEHAIKMKNRELNTDTATIKND